MSRSPQSTEDPSIYGQDDFMSQRKVRLIFVLLAPLLLVMLLIVVGCSDGRPVRVPVSGQVLIDGEPVRDGVIRIMPSNARPALSELDDEGRFTLTTFDVGDGCVVGTHRVQVLGVREEGNRRYWLAPKKYWSPRYRDLSTTVDGPTDSLVIELTWGSGKPFSEKIERQPKPQPEWARLGFESPEAGPGETK
jgi:hypothetical protein